MPVYNEARNLPSVLESLDAQTFDRSRACVFVVDGGSTDESAQILRRWLERGTFPGHLLVNPQRKIPISLNIAIRQIPREAIVLRLDAHTVYGASYIEDAVAALEAAPPDVACIGGAQAPLRGTTFVQRIVEALYTNPMGLGGADFRVGNGVRETDSVYLGAWRPGVLASIGGFDEALQANEDGELAARLRKAGLRILRVPLPCRFIINRGLWGSVRQWNRYGFWRAKMLRRHRDAVRVRHVLSCGAAVLVPALLCSPARAVLAAAAAMYGTAVFAARGEDEPFAVTLACVVFFPVLQFAFAAGMLAGLLGAAPEKKPLAVTGSPAAIES